MSFELKNWKAFSHKSQFKKDQSFVSIWSPFYLLFYCNWQNDMKIENRKERARCCCVKFTVIYIEVFYSDSEYSVNNSTRHTMLFVKRSHDWTFFHLLFVSKTMLTMMMIEISMIQGTTKTYEVILSARFEIGFSNIFTMQWSWTKRTRKYLSISSIDWVDISSFSILKTNIEIYYWNSSIETTRYNIHKYIYKHMYKVGNANIVYGRMP